MIKLSRYGERGKQMEKIVFKLLKIGPCKLHII